MAHVADLILLCELDTGSYKRMNLHIVEVPTYVKTLASSHGFATLFFTREGAL